MRSSNFVSVLVTLALGASAACARIAEARRQDIPGDPMPTIPSEASLVARETPIKRQEPQEVSASPAMEPLPSTTAIPKPANYDAAMAWCNQQGGTPLWAPPLENYEDQKSRKDWADQTGPVFADVQMTKVATADEAKEMSGTQMIVNARAAAIAAWGNMAWTEVQRVFAGGKEKGVAPWCLTPEYEELKLVSPGNSDNSRTFSDESLIQAVTAAGKEDSVNVAIKTFKWPYFIEQAFGMYDANIADAKWEDGEHQAIQMLGALTGEECDILGGYEVHNEDVQDLVKKSGETPMVAIIPEGAEKPGLWAILGCDVDRSRVKMWNHHSDQWFEVVLDTPMKIVHIKGTREGGDGKWAKYKDGAGQKW